MITTVTNIQQKCSPWQQTTNIIYSISFEKEQSPSQKTNKYAKQIQSYLIYGDHHNKLTCNYSSCVEKGHRAP